MRETGRSLLIVGAMILGTVITRFLPFWVFRDGRKMPAFVAYLGKTLPFAAMGLLVVYCLKGVWEAGPFLGAPQLLAVVVVAFLQRWKKNALLSIGAGTVFYMFLVQQIFV